MDVDDCFSKVVGTFGRYQILLFSVLNLYAILASAINLAVVFIGADPEKLHKFNPRVKNDSSILTEWDILDKEWISSLIQSLFFAGFLFGVITFGQISDRFGRRKVLIGGYNFLFPLCIVTSFSSSWQMFAACRFANGFVLGGVSLVMFVYSQELIGRSWWAISGSVFNLLFPIGLLGLVFAAFLIPSWRELIRLLSYLQIPLLIFTWFIPESPRWLYSKGQLQEAERVLIMFAKRNGVKNPVLSLKRNRDEKQHTQRSGFDILKHGQTRKRVLLMAYLWFVNSFVYYALTLAAGDLGKNLYVSEALSALIELPPCIWCMFLLNRKWCGRKRALWSALLVSGTACIGLMAFKHEDKSTAKLILGLTGKMMIASSFNTVYVYTPELFPTCVRNVALGAVSMCARVGGILAAFSTSMIEANSTVSYFMFGATGLTAAMLSFLLPETLGLKPPDTFDDLEKQLPSSTNQRVAEAKSSSKLSIGKRSGDGELNPLIVDEESEVDEHAL